MLKPGSIQPREYQAAIVRAIGQKGNSLVVLPTGLGKSIIAAMLADDALAHGKVLMMAPTKPLCIQHARLMAATLTLPQDAIALLTGETGPSQRKREWRSAKLVIATPQTIRNDLGSGYIDLDDTALILFDEAHRAVGDYAYVQIAKAAPDTALLIGLTASPGGSKSKIEELCRNLRMPNIEARTESDADVAPYLQPLQIDWVEVQLTPPFTTMLANIQALAVKRLETLQKWGFVQKVAMLPKARLFELQRAIQKADDERKWPALSAWSGLFTLSHAHELLETQGITPFLRFIQKSQRERKSRALKTVVNELEATGVLPSAIAAELTGLEHPKLDELKKLLASADQTYIVFAQYRETVKRIVAEINKVPGIRATEFLGRKEGLTQQKQAEILDQFMAGQFNVLVCTQIGEEGLHLPAVDIVVFYEPIPSAIRTIQRRGRAGRTKAGRVVVLWAKSTRDEIYRWVEASRERSMKAVIEKHRSGKRAGQTSMSDFA